MGEGTAIGIIVLVVVGLSILSAAAWVAFVILRDRRLGRPPPTVRSFIPFASESPHYDGPRPAPGGIVGWINDKIRAFQNRNNRTAGGAYEEPLSSNVRGRGVNRGFGPLDPDEAWDARVGTEADAYGPGGYYEEQELGLTEDTSYGGPAAEERGRAKSREPEPYVGGSKAGLDRRYDDEMGTTEDQPSYSPFGDEAEPSSISLRSVSPRPIETRLEPAKGHSKKDSVGDSPTERKSIFQENVE
jgi:hypothetical protein